MSEPAQLGNNYRRGLRHSFWGSAGATLFQFLQMLVFARFAGPAAAGDYVLAATVMGFLTPLVEVGLGQAVVQADRIQANQLITLSRVNFALSCIVFAALVLLAPPLAGWYARPGLADLLRFMGLSLLVAPLGVVPAGLMVRDLRFGAAARIETASAALGFGAVTLLAWLDWGPWAMAVGFLLRTLGSAVAGRWVMRHWFAGTGRQAAPLKSVLPMLRFGSLDLGARWADFLANYLDKLIVGKWLGAEALGYYHLAFTWCVLPTARLGTVVTRVSFPVFARLKEDATALQAFFAKTAQQLILLLFPVYLTLVLFAREIIQMLYGEKWLPAAPLLVAFGLAGLVRTLSAAFPELTRGLGRPEWLLRWMLVWTVALNAVLTVFLCAAPTVESAAWSRVAAKFALEIALLFGLARRCGVDFRPVLRFAGTVLGYLLPVAAAIALTGYWITGVWWGLAFKGAVWVAGALWIGWGSGLRAKFRFHLGGDLADPYL